MEIDKQQKNTKNVTDEYQLHISELNKIFYLPKQKIKIYLELLNCCVKYLNEWITDLIITSCVNILASINYQKKVSEYKKKEKKA